MAHSGVLYILERAAGPQTSQDPGQFIPYHTLSTNLNKRSMYT